MNPGTKQNISLILLSWKRPENLKPVTDRLKACLPIDEIFWVNNNPQEKLVAKDGVTLIEHSKDLGLWSRFTTAALAKNDNILLHDDDLLVDAAALQKMWLVANRVPGTNVGIHGRNCASGYNMKNIYGSCEILLTQCVFTTKKRCLTALSNTPEFDDTFPNSNPRGNGEDILLSFMGANFSYPARVECISDDGDAIHRRKGHILHRTAVLRWCRSLFPRMR